MRSWAVGKGLIMSLTNPVRGYGARMVLPSCSKVSQDGQAIMTPHQTVTECGSSWEALWPWTEWLSVIKAIPEGTVNRRLPADNTPKG